MTFIDFFVAAYYSHKPISKVKKIIKECGYDYLVAKEEYLCAKEWRTTEQLVDYIAGKIKYKKTDFINKYKPNN